MPYRKLFRKFEQILSAHGGKPHWAKAHNQSQNELTKLYPRFQDFLALRARVDPTGVFLNPYTRRHLLGELGEPLDLNRLVLSVDLKHC